MNVKDSLLNLLAEEACEVAQNALKCVRFTTEHRYYEASNLERLNTELSDVASVIKMLQDIGVDVKFEASEKKIASIKQYMDVSRSMGALDVDAA